MVAATLIVQHRNGTELNTAPAVDRSRPPRFAKFLLLLVHPRNREHLLGDLEEEHTTIVLPEYGEQRARFWYWWQVASSIAPLLWALFTRLEVVAWLRKVVR